MKAFLDKHFPVAVWGMIVAVTLFALSAYIKKEVSNTLSNYLPIAVWAQWSEERGVRLGRIESRQEQQEKARSDLKDEVEKRFNIIENQLTRIITLLEGHMNNSIAKPTSLNEIQTYSNQVHGGFTK